MSDPIDLSLVPLYKLIKEAESRSVAFICAYQTPEDNQKTGEMAFYYGKGNWCQSVALAAILQNDVVNNWSGELKTLQRIAQEGL